MFRVRIVAHTVSSFGNDIVTFEIEMPKSYVAEFNTHKAEIERNSASSRAVPTSKIIQHINVEPVVPHEWRYNSKGMAPQEHMSLEDATEATKIWLEAKDAILPYVYRLQELNADKQRINRLLEPWMWTVIVCTMTGSGGIGVPNFFGLRDKPDVQPEFALIAKMMHNLYHRSKPHYDELHLPYVTLEERFELSLTDIEFALVSSARCGRVTYYKQGEQRDVREEMDRAIKFFQSGHFSPLRHASFSGEDKWYGNMYGWIPVSKIISEGKDYVESCCERYQRKKM